VEKAPNETFGDIAGLTDQVCELKEAVELPLTHPELFEEMGIRPPKGVILYGEPGTGIFYLLHKNMLFYFQVKLCSPKPSLTTPKLLSCESLLQLLSRKRLVKGLNWSEISSRWPKKTHL